jgi:hypothetical protein
MTVVARRTRNTIVHDAAAAAAVAAREEEHSSSTASSSSNSNSKNVINRMHTRRRSALLNEADPLLVKAQHHRLISNSHSPRPDIDMDMASSSSSTTTISKKGKGRWPKKEDSNSNILIKNAAATTLPLLSTRRLSSTSTTTASPSAVSRPVLMKAAKSRSNRGRASLRAVEQDNMEELVEEQQDDEIILHEVPDNVINHAGLTEIPSSLIDSLPNVAFPKQGVNLATQDIADPLLILIGKVLASVDNRALTPKEIALILARRHGWQFRCVNSFFIIQIPRSPLFPHSPSSF